VTGDDALFVYVMAALLSITPAGILEWLRRRRDREARERVGFAFSVGCKMDRASAAESGGEK
jgi:hypothetical protein